MSKLTKEFWNVTDESLDEANYTANIMHIIGRLRDLEPECKSEVELRIFLDEAAFIMKVLNQWCDHLLLMMEETKDE